jgi:hypothetical protein
MLLSGTYPRSADISGYLDCWNDWYEGKGINRTVAKDIDNIQTIYKFCSYCNLHPEMFDEDTIIYWLSGVNEIESEIGKDIATKIIKKNPAFAHIIEQAGDIFND